MGIESADVITGLCSFYARLATRFVNVVRYPVASVLNMPGEIGGNIRPYVGVEMLDTRSLTERDVPIGHALTEIIRNGLTLIKPSAMDFHDGVEGIDKFC